MEGVIVGIGKKGVDMAASTAWSKFQETRCWKNATGKYRKDLETSLQFGEDVWNTLTIEQRKIFETQSGGGEEVASSHIELGKTLHIAMMNRVTKNSPNKVCEEWTKGIDTATANFTKAVNSYLISQGAMGIEVLERIAQAINRLTEQKDTLSSNSTQNKLY